MSSLEHERVEHRFFSLGYDEQHEQAAWVAYILKASHLKNCTKRTNNFREDPMVTTRTPQTWDYSRSGHDRGHLLPAGHMKFSRMAMSETFYMSNIVW